MRQMRKSQNTWQLESKKENRNKMNKKQNQNSIRSNKYKYKNRMLKKTRMRQILQMNSRIDRQNISKSKFKIR